MGAQPPQYRHWIGTVHEGHLSSDTQDALPSSRFKAWWTALTTAPALKYATGQLELCADTGTLHLQVYTEWQRSLRRSEVNNRAKAHWEARKGTRTEARQYCRKADTRLMAGEWATPLEHGTWRPDGRKLAKDRPKQRALDYLIRQALTPAEIAVLDPEAYFAHHRAINELYKARVHAFTVGIQAGYQPPTVIELQSRCEEE